MTPRRAVPVPPAAARVLVVGVGGLGCPAALALAEAGVGALVLVDPDEVEPSNLPRQVLFGPQDVGRPKSEVAARRLARPGLEVEAHVGRLDDRTADGLLEDVDVVLDATDGARTKDWVNALCVARSVALVHAAGLGSEGRLLDVPAGGRPCLACLFGRLVAEGGTCADLGVWNGVVGATGALAASWALGRLAAPGAPSRGYAVLDLAGGRGATLAAAADADCPVCGPRAPRALEPYPEADAACAPPGPDAAADGDAGAATSAPVLDLVGEACPMNLLRARRRLEATAPGATLAIRLDGEGRATVPDGLAALGHAIVGREQAGDVLEIMVRRAAGGQRA